MGNQICRTRSDLWTQTLRPRLFNTNAAENNHSTNRNAGDGSRGSPQSPAANMAGKMSCGDDVNDISSARDAERNPVLFGQDNYGSIKKSAKIKMEEKTNKMADDFMETQRLGLRHTSKMAGSNSGRKCDTGLMNNNIVTPDKDNTEKNIKMPANESKVNRFGSTSFHGNMSSGKMRVHPLKTFEMLPHSVVTNLEQDNRAASANNTTDEFEWDITLKIKTKRIKSFQKEKRTLSLDDVDFSQDTYTQQLMLTNLGINLHCVYAQGQVKVKSQIHEKN